MVEPCHEETPDCDGSTGRVEDSIASQPRTAQLPPEGPDLVAERLSSLIARPVMPVPAAAPYRDNQQSLVAP
jgi:hypothetical protein